MGKNADVILSIISASILLECCPKGETLKQGIPCLDRNMISINDHRALLLIYIVAEFKLIRNLLAPASAMFTDSSSNFVCVMRGVCSSDSKFKSSLDCSLCKFDGGKCE